MINLTDAQIRALRYADTHGEIHPGEGISRATLKVLRHEGFVTYTHVAYNTWTAAITDTGRRWLHKYGTPEILAAKRAAEDKRVEYRDRAAVYVKRCIPVLERLGARDHTTGRAVDLLKTVKHPGRAPGKVESAGWWLRDNNYSGSAFSIGTALAEIGERCLYRAYPINDGDLERLGEYEKELADFTQNVGMIEAAR